MPWRWPGQQQQRTGGRRPRCACLEFALLCIRFGDSYSPPASVRLSVLAFRRMSGMPGKHRRCYVSTVLGSSCRGTRQLENRRKLSGDIAVGFHGAARVMSSLKKARGMFRTMRKGAEGGRAKDSHIGSATQGLIGHPGRQPWTMTRRARQALPVQSRASLAGTPAARAVRLVLSNFISRLYPCP
ncbi:uncharacterized protein J3D65DRAFT_444634 [Phyllosticta citribraziliensis]|uniref:Uncharacterized protein n=1 Tax=Phyllosticta citribraziliensis TaxID=989973 RepID=A0ABR1LKG6_9PEZI